MSAIVFITLFMGAVVVCFIAQIYLQYLSARSLAKVVDSLQKRIDQVESANKEAREAKRMAESLLEAENGWRDSL